MDGASSTVLASALGTQGPNGQAAISTFQCNNCYLNVGADISGASTFGSSLIGYTYVLAQYGITSSFSINGVCSITSNLISYLDRPLAIVLPTDAPTDVLQEAGNSFLSYVNLTVCDNNYKPSVTFVQYQQNDQSSQTHSVTPTFAFSPSVITLITASPSSAMTTAMTASATSMSPAVQTGAASSASSSKNHLGMNAKIGIGVGVSALFVVIAAAVGLFLVVRRRRRYKSKQAANKIPYAGKPELSGQGVSIHELDGTERKEMNASLEALHSRELDGGYGGQELRGEAAHELRGEAAHELT